MTLSAIGEGIPRDIVAWCAPGELLKPDGSISEAVWRAMAAHRPVIVQHARDRLYRVCVRTFRIEADAVVALVLFYNKQKLARRLVAGGGCVGRARAPAGR